MAPIAHWPASEMVKLSTHRSGTGQLPLSLSGTSIYYRHMHPICKNLWSSCIPRDLDTKPEVW